MVAKDFQGLLVQPFFLKQGNHTPDAPLFLGVILNTIEYLLQFDFQGFDDLCQTR